jgi:restriction system protein
MTNGDSSREFQLPKQFCIKLPVLKVLSDAGRSLPTGEAVKKTKTLFPQLTPEALNVRNKSGESILSYLIMWARLGLVKEGAIDGSVRGIWTITEKGRQILLNEWNSWIPVYLDYYSEGGRVYPLETSGKETTGKIIADRVSDLTPLETIDKARKEVSDNVEVELLQRLRKLDPGIFEKVVGELLERSGYGSRDDDTIKVTGRPNDGGIDGECVLDKLGLYSAKFQAKRYAEGNSISGPSMNEFIGSLDVHRSSVGIFITTSDFTFQAIEHAKRSGKIRLISGKQFAKIMVENGLGVHKHSIDIIDGIDEDYFTDLT